MWDREKEMTNLREREREREINFCYFTIQNIAVTLSIDELDIWLPGVTRLKKGKTNLRTKTLPEKKMLW